jgi:hypothetical protein
MKPAEVSLTCAFCDEATEYCDSVPDASLPVTHPSG